MNPTLLNALGAAPRPADPRDYTFDMHPLAGSAAVLPTPEDFLPVILDQGKVMNNCGPEGQRFYHDFLRGGQPRSPKWLSKQTRLRDAFTPASNMGTNMRTVFQADQKSGMIPLLSMLDDAQTDAPIDYWSAVGITPALAAEAMKDTITGYGFKDPGFTYDELQADLAKYGMLACRIHLGTGFFTNLKTGQQTWNPYQLFPLQLGTYVDDHFVILVRQDIAKQAGLNAPTGMTPYATQWSPEYGFGGLGFFDPTYMPNVCELGLAW